MSEAQTEILMYGTTWCGDTRRARNYFEQHQIPYRFIDIDQSAEARKYVEKVNRGNRSVPTIVFPDGSLLVEPSLSQLEAKFLTK